MRYGRTHSLRIQSAAGNQASGLERKDSHHGLLDAASSGELAARERACRVPAGKSGSHLYWRWHRSGSVPPSWWTPTPTVPPNYPIRSPLRPVLRLTGFFLGCRPLSITGGVRIPAGRPTLVVPFIAEQKFWGTQVARMGLVHLRLAGCNLPRCSWPEHFRPSYTMQPCAPAHGRLRPI